MTSEAVSKTPVVRKKRLRAYVLKCQTRISWCVWICRMESFFFRHYRSIGLECETFINDFRFPPALSLDLSISFIKEQRPELVSIPSRAFLLSPKCGWLSSFQVLIEHCVRKEQSPSKMADWSRYPSKLTSSEAFYAFDTLNKTNLAPDKNLRRCNPPQYSCSLIRPALIQKIEAPFTAIRMPEMKAQGRYLFDNVVKKSLAEVELISRSEEWKKKRWEERRNKSRAVVWMDALRKSACRIQSVIFAAAILQKGRIRRGVTDAQTPQVR